MLNRNIPYVHGINLQITLKLLILDFIEYAPSNSETYSTGVSATEEKAKYIELTKLLSKNVIRMCPHEKGNTFHEYLFRPKADGTYRLILNLRKHNEEMSFVHFKMETL